MPVITFLLMNSVVITGSFFITYKLLRLPEVVGSLICYSIVYFAQIVLSELLLGVFGSLTLSNVIIFNLLILSAVGLISKNRVSSFSLRKFKDLAAVFFKNKIILFIFSLILGFGLVKISINLCNPPFGWDSLNYHFTFPVEWLKNANLINPITISDDPSPSYYPINASLFFLWLIFPFKNVFIADLGQVLFFILAFLAVYAIAKKIRLSWEASLYSAALFLLIPNFFKQLEIAYIDVMVAALFLACVNYLFSLHNEFSFKNVLLYSASLGLFIGTKTLALPYGAILILPFLYISCKNIKKYPLVMLAAFIVIALGGFTYLRNFLQTNNPLYPLDFKFFGKAVFKGVMDIAVYRAHFKVQDYALSKLLFHEGLGVQSLIIILPGIFLALPAALIKKKKFLNFNFFYFLSLPFLLYYIYRFIIPLANTRYLYPLLAVSIIIGFYTIETLNIPRRILRIIVVICALASIFELADRSELAAALILSFSVFFCAVFLAKFIQTKSWRMPPAFIVALFVFLIVILIALEKDYVKNEYPRYIKMEEYSGFWPDATRAWNWLNENTAGDNIAYVGRPVPFPLYGTDFKNNVYYVSVNKTEPAKLHYFPHSRYRWGYDFLELHRNLEEKGNYRFGADYPVWLNNLLKRSTDYVFVYSLHQTKEIEFPVEDAWAKSDPGKFVPVFANGTIHIYKCVYP